MLYPSVIFKMPTKNKFFCLLLTVDTLTPVFRDDKQLKSLNCWRQHINSLRKNDSTVEKYEERAAKFPHKDFKTKKWLETKSMWMRSSRVWMRSSRVWMRSSRVASDSQCRSRNCPGFDPSILRLSGIWGAADEAVLNIVHEKKSSTRAFGDKSRWLFAARIESL